MNETITLLLDHYNKPVIKIIMFGTFRYGLALTVAFAHLWVQKAPWAAHYAVFAFYTLSGYLMTRVLSEVYPYTINGLKRFCANRALRLYPTYYAVFSLNIACIYLIPPEIVNVSTSTHMPHTLWEWVANLSIFGITQWRPEGLKTLIETRVINNAWSLNIELWFYVILSLCGAMRRIEFVVVWVIIGILQVGYGFYHGYDFYDRYSPVTAGILPFAIGSLIYYMVRSWSCTKLCSATLCCVGISAWVILPFLGSTDGTRLLHAEAESLYIALLISAVLIFGLANLQTKSFPRWALVDEWLGRLSYPIFLCHFTSGIIMKWIFPTYLSQTNGSLFLASLPVIHFMALMLYAVVERPLERLRAIIHNNQSHLYAAP